MKLMTLLLAASLAFFAVACGDDDDDDGPANPTATPEVSDGLPTAPPEEDTATPQAEDTATPADTATPSPDIGSTDPFEFDPLPDPPEAAMLVDVRLAAHPDEGYDRIVFEWDGPRPAGIVQYRDELFACAIGTPVDPEGDALLHVNFLFAVAHTEEGEVSFPTTNLTPPGNSILEIEETCDFEGGVEWAIGVPDERPFTVTLLEEPSRVVIDVAH